MTPYQTYALGLALVMGVSGLMGFLLGFYLGTRPAKPTKV